MLEVMKQALEALKENQHLVADNERHAYVMEYNSIIEKCEQALAQPEQEPVAMRYDFDGYGYKYIDNGSGSDWKTRIKEAEPVYALPQRTDQEQQIETLKRCLFQMQEAAKDLVEQAKSLPPPQRTWVNLTAEEIEDIRMEYHVADGVVLTGYERAIEAKLRSKNI